MIYIMLLLLLAIWVSYTMYADFHMHGVFSFSMLSRAIFLVVYVASGFAHVVFTENFYRGFFDVNLSVHDYNPIVIFSLYVFYFFLRNSQSVNFSIPNHKTDGDLSVSYWFLGFLLFVIGLFASYKLASSIDISVVERNRELPPGVAKFVFLSHWMIWGVAIFFIKLIDCIKDKDSLLSLAFFSACVFFISASLVWTGGRAIVVLMVLPLLWVYSRLSVRNFLISVFLSGLVFVFYAVAVTALRKEGYSVETTNLSEVLDWELGRYSMVAFAYDFIATKSVLWGGTYFDGISRIVLAPIYFSGVGADYIGSFDGTTVSYVGDAILGDPTKTYIVPGALPEAVMNFGFFGVVLLPVFIGFLLRFLDDLIRSNSHDKILLLFYSYIGSVVTVNFFSGTFLSALNYIFYSGLPLVILFLFRFIRR